MEALHQYDSILMECCSYKHRYLKRGKAHLKLGKCSIFLRLTSMLFQSLTKINNWKEYSSPLSTLDQSAYWSNWVNCSDYNFFYQQSVKLFSFDESSFWGICPWPVVQGHMIYLSTWFASCHFYPIIVWKDWVFFNKAEFFSHFTWSWWLIIQCPKSKRVSVKAVQQVHIKLSGFFILRQL